MFVVRSAESTIQFCYQHKTCFVLCILKVISAVVALYAMFHLAAVRYVAIALRNSTKGEKPMPRNYWFILLVFFIIYNYQSVVWLNKNDISEISN